MHATKLGAALALTLAFAAASPAARAADMAAGKAKANEVCRTCHGANGISVQPNVPNLAGQPAQYLEEQLINYRSGARQNEQMSIIAQELSDEDIANLAAWYSEIKITTKVPQ